MARVVKKTKCGHYEKLNRKWSVTCFTADRTKVEAVYNSVPAVKSIHYQIE